MELGFATLFVMPATFKLGFLLASCYCAGAIAAFADSFSSLDAFRRRRPLSTNIRSHCVRGSADELES